MRRVFIEQEESAPERKRREHHRLDALIAYCEAPACRRRMLLRYFGEETGPCGNCDACLDPVETLDGTAEARLVLAAIQGTGQMFGAGHIIGVLRGSESEKIIRFRHQALSVFGAGAGRPLREWQGIIRQMVAAGLLEIDIAGYGGLHATPAGSDLMRGDGAFRYRPDRIGADPVARRATSAASKAVDELDAAAAELLKSLKILRLELAKARNVPAYVIFSDRSLIDMAARRPRTAGEFAQVFGVGAAKQEKFAAAFLRVIAETAAQEHGI
jgi:ATP-dependent DNA helicase RecQ